MKTLIGQKSQFALSLVDQMIRLAVSAELVGVRNANRIASRLYSMDRERLESSRETHGRHAQLSRQSLLVEGKCDVS